MQNSHVLLTIVSSYPLAPNHLLAYCQAHSNNSINAEGQDILNSYARDEKKVIVEYRKKQGKYGFVELTLDVREMIFCCDWHGHL